MEINTTDVITLSDNNKYVASSKVEFKNNVYYYLMDICDNKNIKFCVQKNDRLSEIEDEEEIKSLLPLFWENSKGLVGISE